MQGPDEAFALGESIAKIIHQPVLRSYRISVDPMALLEPGLSEIVFATLLDVMREAMDEVVSRGVPRGRRSASRGRGAWRGCRSTRLRGIDRRSRLRSGSGDDVPWRVNCPRRGFRRYISCIGVGGVRRRGRSDSGGRGAGDSEPDGGGSEAASPRAARTRRLTLLGASPLALSSIST